PVARSTPCPPSSTPLPYTTLFRSDGRLRAALALGAPHARAPRAPAGPPRGGRDGLRPRRRLPAPGARQRVVPRPAGAGADWGPRARAGDLGRADATGGRVRRPVVAVPQPPPVRAPGQRLRPGGLALRPRREAGLAGLAAARRRPR